MHQAFVQFAFTVIAGYDGCRAGLSFLIGIFFKQQAKISIGLYSSMTSKAFLIKNRTDIFIKTDPSGLITAASTGINSQTQNDDAMKNCHVDG